MLVLCPEDRIVALSRCINYAAGERERQARRGSCEVRVDVDYISLRKKTVNLEGRLFPTFSEHFLKKFVDNQDRDDQLLRLLDRFSE